VQTSSCVSGAISLGTSVPSHLQLEIGYKSMIPDPRIEAPCSLPGQLLVYHQLQMRRDLSIFLVLLFGLGPLTATLTADDDSRLPPCCRRHGAHHCAMSDAMMARMVQAASGKPIVTAPAHCPFYPTNSNATVASIHALTPSAASQPSALEQSHPRPAYCKSVCMALIRTHAGRGPPFSVSG
jgi:hypothetical protein